MPTSILEAPHEKRRGLRWLAAGVALSSCLGAVGGGAQEGGVPERRVLKIGNNGSDANAGCFAFSPDGKLLAAPQDDGSVLLFDVATGAPSEPPLRGGYNVGAFTYVFSNQRPARYFGFDPEGRTLIWSWGKKLALWDVAASCC